MMWLLPAFESCFIVGEWQLNFIARTEESTEHQVVYIENIYKFIYNFFYNILRFNKKLADPYVPCIPQTKSSGYTILLIPATSPCKPFRFLHHLLRTICMNLLHR